MTDVERDIRRNAKIARTLLRLKHSLRADDEIEQFLEAQRAGLLNGEVMRLEANISDLLDER